MQLKGLSPIQYQNQSFE
ncbi:hypothetical protein FWK45_06600 [Histophilus somni]|uniref:Uncharacterized protein n=1 Tax=Histophilus somni TaxID=731 RepID=A0A9Q6Z1E9_HISSO|nr:hypothetical protein BTV18_06020 [Histophilus somni]ARU67641.1 hypothetical protein BTV19_06445 [Histophilus somni]ARU69524.1 hypothetical protein BTV16_06445 [Histophilus somni]ARU71401.1 hypothetical protein BTV20_06450 [Histophilus somni]ARU73274.1 hypothetical protein BTV17_06440 [Histophilus somni]